MTTMDRWRTAQRYERGFWQGVAEGVAAGRNDSVDFYNWRADRLRHRLQELGLHAILDGSGSLLEVGSGPVGVVPFLPGREKVAVDPLAQFYAADPRLAALRDPHVGYLSAMGENLPFESGAHDLVIMENCIDHVRDPRAVLSELRRVLRPAGVLYLTVNVRTRWGYLMHRALSRLRIDPGHPHTMTPRRIRWMVEESGFRIADLDTDPLWPAWKADLFAGALRPLVKGLLGVSESVTSLLATKVGAAGPRSGFG